MTTNIEKYGLSIGSKAPSFTTVDTEKNEVSLETLLKNFRGVLINFFRGSWWAYCKKELKVLIEKRPEIERLNVMLISIAADSTRNLRKLHERYQSSFPFIADKGGQIATMYNVYFTTDHPDTEHTHDEFQDKHAIPSKYLINKDGIIVWRYIGTKEDRPVMGTMIDAIEKNL